MSRDDVLRKLRKLLSMTTANGCTEAEAAAAAGLAQKLMLRYKLDATSLPQEEQEDIRDWEDPLDIMPGKQKQHWRGTLAVVLSRANGCTVFWDHRYDKAALTIIGTASDVTAVRYIYQFCISEMDRLSRRYRGNGATWLNNWRHGVVAGIRISLREAREAARQEYHHETGTALVVVDQQLAVIDQRLAQTASYGRTKFRLRSGGAPGGYRDDSARATGQRDGRSINLRGGRALPGTQRRLK